MNRFRRLRVALFLELISEWKRVPIRILDVGGRLQFWHQTPVWNNDRYRIRVVNLEEGMDVETVEASLLANNISKVQGDALKLQRDDLDEIDVLFSNSVIEHVGDWEAQQKMAQFFVNCGKPYFLQTPNRTFPFEPHFRVPFFAQLPICIRAALVQHFDLGCFRRRPNYEEAKALVRNTRCLSERELRSLFPSAMILKERYWGLTKSLIAHNIPLK